MKKVKSLLIHSVFIFLLCALCHFGYTVFPSFISSIFFPVNESVFEHLKMLFTAELIFTLASFFLKKEENTPLKIIIRGYLSIFILLLLYLPCYYLFGEIMILTFIILFISIYITEYILTFLNKKKHYYYLNIISVFLIILTYILFTYLTYHPLKEELFLDKEHNKYGIDILNK